MDSTNSHPLNKTIHHPLFAGLVEADGQLVAVHGGDVAVAEFQVKHALADGEVRRRAGGFGDQFAFDGERGGGAALLGVDPHPAGVAGRPPPFRGR